MINILKMIVKTIQNQFFKSKLSKFIRGNNYRPKIENQEKIE